MIAINIEIDSPNNFLLNHRQPALHDLIYLQLRQSDTVNEEDIALVLVGGIFVGWIAQQDIAIIYARIQNRETLIGRIDQVGIFHWANGSGQCKRGQLTLFSVDWIYLLLPYLFSWRRLCWERVGQWGAEEEDSEIGSIVSVFWSSKASWAVTLLSSLFS